MILEQAALKYKGRVIFERLIISANFKRVPKLFVENEACFLFLSKGAFLFRTPTSLLSFTEGDAMLAKCGSYFIENVSINPKVEQQTLSVIGAFFYPSMVKQFFQTDLSLSQFQSNFDTIKISIEPLMSGFIDSLHYLLNNPALADDNLLLTKLKELLLLLSKSEKAKSINEFVNSLFVPHEYIFNEIIQQNLYSSLSLEQFAHLTSLSLATFKRKFSEYYKESPAKYILRQKLEKAAQLLQHKTKSVSEIAYECGFETISNFDKAFKKQFNQTPSEFRMS
jgi:AraC family transcriptional regulator, exoenzyme S synthesis regulatory protein ExsA